MGLRLATVRKVARSAVPDREVREIAQRERERLGRELHDGLGQSLAGIAALGAALSRRLEAQADPAGSAAAAEIAALLNQAIVQARDLAHGLCRLGPDGTGLADALEQLAADVRHRFEVSCKLECDGPALQLDRATELHLYRIVQEAVQNAIAHGRADRIDIRLGNDGAAGVLSVRDNGAGMSQGPADREGMGLRSMEYRARAIGGIVRVVPHPLRGTVATCVFPLRRKRCRSRNVSHAGGAG